MAAPGALFQHIDGIFHGALDQHIALAVSETTQAGTIAQLIPDIAQGVVDQGATLGWGESEGRHGHSLGTHTMADPGPERTVGLVGDDRRAATVLNGLSRQRNHRFVQGFKSGG